METSLQQRRHLHAGQVGVPLGELGVNDKINVSQNLNISFFFSTQYASWDLAFHMLPFAKVDPEFAKKQLVLFLREWYMAPNGQIPGQLLSLSCHSPCSEPLWLSL